MSRASLKLAIVVAVAENGVIGRGNELPWQLPDDLRRFKELTLGKPIIMGRRTHESIGRALPGRMNIVVTRQAGLQAPGCIVVHSFADALLAAADAPGDATEAAVIGGAQLYGVALPEVSRIHLTRVHASIPGDTLFPALQAHEWRETTVAQHPADERHAYSFSYVEMTRVS